MPSTEALIFDALAGRVATLGLGLPIAWPNRNFTPVGRYLEISFIPNTAFRVGITSSAPHRYVGLLQISVWWEQDRGSEPIDIAGQVAAHFPADLRLTSGGVTVRITKAPDVAGMLVDEQGVQIPVTCSWEAFA